MLAAQLLGSLPQPPAGWDMFSGWAGYRLTDMFFGNRRELEMGMPYHEQHFPDSIAVQYVRREQAEGRGVAQWRLLQSVVNSNVDERPSESTLVIHVRTGDVVDQDHENSVLSLLTHQKITSYEARFIEDDDEGCAAEHAPGDAASWDAWLSAESQFSSSHCWAAYVRPLRYYMAVLARTPSSVTNITLVSGSHFPLSDDGQDHLWQPDMADSEMTLIGSFDKSWRYLHVLQAFFTSHGYHTTLRVGRNPDEDVRYMSQAAHFIPSAGGFSRLIMKLVHLNGGQFPCDVVPYSWGNQYECEFQNTALP